jgi:hypothetical protein
MASMNSEDTSIRASNGAAAPKPPAEGAIQAAKSPAAKGPPAINDVAFLARCRNILDEHNKMLTRGRTPPMWGFVQGGAFAMACLAAFAVYRAMTAGDAPETPNDFAGVMFVVTFFVVLFAPDTMLYLSRRTRRTITYQHLEDAIRMALRTFPDEVEHCGGVAVLADRVELAALVEVLQNQVKPDPLEKKD